MKENLKKEICSIVDDWTDDELADLLQIVKAESKKRLPPDLAEKAVGQIVVKPKVNGDIVMKIRSIDIYFSAQDIERMSAICGKSSSGKEGAKNLYTWFVGNRIDVINNAQLTGQADQILIDIYNSLKDR